MFARVLLLLAMALPLAAQEDDVTKYLAGLRAHSEARQETSQRLALIEYRKKVEAATDRQEKAQIYSQIAIVEVSLKEPEEAIEAARRAHELAPADGRKAGDLAHLLADNGQNAEASAILGAEVADAEALVRRAEQLLDDGETSLAAACLEQAQKALPDDAAVDDRLAVVYLRAERVDEAIGTLERASAKAPGSPLIHLHLAFAWAQRSRPDHARSELSLALASDPSDELRAAIEDLRGLLDRPQ